MAKAKRRNHYIPRFLLNRFASRVDHKKKRYWVWELSKSDKPRTLSTKNIGASKYFYGKPDTGIEDAFSIVESRFGEALVAIDAGDSVNDHADELRKFAWSQGLRTRALREQFANTTDNLILEIANTAGTDEAQAAVVKELESSFDEVIDRELSALPPTQRALAAQFLKKAGVRNALLNQARANITATNLQPIFTEIGRTFINKGGMTTAAERGHIRGLQHMLQGGFVNVPDTFYPQHWQVLTDPDGTVVLSDTCVFGVSEEGKRKSLLGAVKSWHEIYLPISKNQIIVGRKNEGRPSLDIRQVNRTSAELALSYIYASQLTDAIKVLVPLIATGEPVLEQSEIIDLVRSGWRKDVDEH